MTALINHTKALGASAVTTPAVDMTGADFIILGVNIASSSGTTPTDSLGNAYTGLTAQADTTDNFFTRFWICQAPTVSNSMTFSLSDSSFFLELYVAGFSGSLASPTDQQNGAFGAPANSTQATGSVTPTTDNQLVVAVIAEGGTGALSIDSGFTLVDSDVFTGGSHFGGGLAYLVQTAAAAVNPTWTWSGNASNARSTAIATFKMAAGGAAANDDERHYPRGVHRGVHRGIAA